MSTWLKPTTPNNVFTPASIAQKNYLKRECHISRLESSLKTTVTQLIIYGCSGSGKTALIINELNRLKTTFIKSQCSSDSTYASLALRSFDALAFYYLRSYNYICSAL